MGGIYAHPRGEARPRVHLRYRSATAMSSDYVPRVNWLEAANASSGKLSKGFDFLGYRVVPGRRLRSSAESKRRFAEKFRGLYEQGASSMRLWRYAECWCRWRRAGLTGLESLKGGLRRVVIRQLKMLGIVGFPIPTYDAQTGTWQMRKSSASG